MLGKRRLPSACYKKYAGHIHMHRVDKAHSLSRTSVPKTACWGPASTTYERGPNASWLAYPISTAPHPPRWTYAEGAIRPGRRTHASEVPLHFILFYCFHYNIVDTATAPLGTTTAIYPLCTNNRVELTHSTSCLPLWSVVHRLPLLVFVVSDPKLT